MIKRADRTDSAALAQLAVLLWSEHSVSELENEFASDCELVNEESLRFHTAVGFEGANRIICFKKRL